MIKVDNGQLGMRTKLMTLGLSLSCPGNGIQPFPWIHIDDIVAMYIQAIENEKFSGVYNAVGKSINDFY